MTGRTDEEEEKWKNRSTTLRRLGRQYSPDVTPEVASRRLKQWIVGNPVLLGLLHENGWTASRRVLTPRQVEQIVRILGEPTCYFWLDPKVTKKSRLKLLRYSVPFVRCRV